MRLEAPNLNTKRDWALWWASNGFHVFPVKPDSKEPAINEWPERATTNKDQVRLWWTQNPEYNIGVSCNRFQDDFDGLIVIDVDVKGDIDGRPTAKRLETEGAIERSSLSATTVSGGTHIYHRRPAHMRPRFGALGPGIDVLAGRRYFVSSGSVLRGKTPTLHSGSLLYPSQRLIEICSRSLSEPENTKDPAPEIEINETRAEDRAKSYLQEKAAHPVSDGSRNVVAYQMAARLKDFGISEPRCLELLRQWDKFEPPLNGELDAAVGNAYRYGKNFIGSDAPEKQFPPIIKESSDTPDEKELHPYELINQDHFLVTVKGGVHIVHEYVDEDGTPALQRMSIDDFHVRLMPLTMQVQRGKELKEVQVSKYWLGSTKRREYKGIQFKPGLPADEGWYNLWRGFSYEPKEGGHYALDMFLEHTKENVCENDNELFRWLIGYFAHLIQKPHEKPRTGLVFQGKEGVGKNALVDRVGALINKHYVVTSKRANVTSNFNAFMENKLLVVLNEVTWGGQKEADGILKNLTDGGEKHLIEKKYVDAYDSKNLLRPVIIGNEAWLVAASAHARRYAVFSVGESRLQDISFFEKMRIGMEEGGYCHLLHYLLNFDLSGIEVNKCPNTKGLMEQKKLSLNPIGQWWFDCLSEGTIVGGDFEHRWPKSVKTNRFQDAFRTYWRSQAGSFRGSNTSLGILLRDYSSVVRKRVSEGGDRIYAYVLPELEAARREFDEKMKIKTEWESVEES